MHDNFDLAVSEAKGQQNESWHKDRLGKFTASKFGTIMKTGRSKSQKFSDGCMTYIYEKVAEILTMSPHIVTSQATEWGNDFEEEACLRYEQLTHQEVRKIGFLVYNEYTGGSPDGLIGEKGMIEIKCPYNPANHAKCLVTGEIYNKDHIWQIQGNLMITDRQWCDFVTYDPRVQEESLQINVITIERNEEMILQIQDRLKEVKEELDRLTRELS